MTDVGVLENIQTFRIGGHEAILDAIVNHFDKMAGAAGAAMQIAVLRLARLARRANSARRGGCSRSKALENCIEMLDNPRLAANHLAITPLHARTPPLTPTST